MIIINAPQPPGFRRSEPLMQSSPYLLCFSNGVTMISACSSPDWFTGRLPLPPRYRGCGADIIELCAAAMEEEVAGDAWSGSPADGGLRGVRRCAGMAERFRCPDRTWLRPEPPRDPGRRDEVAL